MRKRNNIALLKRGLSGIPGGEEAGVKNREIYLYLCGFLIHYLQPLILPSSTLLVYMKLSAAST